jgi:hypothetical protein
MTNREGAGLSEIVATTYEIDTQNEARGILRRYGLGGMLRVLSRIVSFSVREGGKNNDKVGIQELAVQDCTVLWCLE